MILAASSRLRTAQKMVSSPAMLPAMPSNARPSSAAAAAMATPVPTPEPTPEILIVDQLPGVPAEGYGFDPVTSEPEATPAPSSQPVVESTLPPTSI